MKYAIAILGLAAASVIWFLMQRAGERTGTPSCVLTGRCACGREDATDCPERDSSVTVEELT